MKPLRAKRVGPRRSRPKGIQLVGVGWGVGVSGRPPDHYSPCGVPFSTPASAGVFRLAVGRRDPSLGTSKARADWYLVAGRRGRPFGARRRRAVRRGKPPVNPGCPATVGESDARRWGLPPMPSGGRSGGCPRPGSQSLAACKRSVTHPTRLETRTKESNMCASQWAN